jgi:hypothetical protein
MAKMKIAKQAFFPHLLIIGIHYYQAAWKIQKIE